MHTHMNLSHNLANHGWWLSKPNTHTLQLSATAKVVQDTGCLLAASIDGAIFAKSHEPAAQPYSMSGACSGEERRLSAGQLPGISAQPTDTLAQRSGLTETSTWRGRNSRGAGLERGAGQLPDVDEQLLAIDWRGGAAAPFRIGRIQRDSAVACIHDLEPLGFRAGVQLGLALTTAGVRLRQVISSNCASTIGN